MVGEVYNAPDFTVVKSTIVSTLISVLVEQLSICIIRTRTATILVHNMLF